MNYETPMAHDLHRCWQRGLADDEYRRNDGIVHALFIDPDDGHGWIITITPTDVYIIDIVDGKVAMEWREICCEAAMIDEFGLV